MTNYYQSSIPDSAIERIVTYHLNKSKWQAEYLVIDEVIGWRVFDDNEELQIEIPLKNGSRHGFEYWWDAPDHLSEKRPFVDGVEHGTTLQFGPDGQIIGTYTMDRGTGIDLWRWLDEDGTTHLSEARYTKDGNRHGFEWWFNANPTLIHTENHFFDGQPHGIERQWNEKGHLRRGYPRYFIHGDQVNKKKYVQACASDPTLPPFRVEDNNPHREFPDEIKPHLSMGK